MKHELTLEEKLNLLQMGIVRVGTDSEEPEHFVVDEDFLSTWKEVGTMTKEIKSFKTETPVSGGVRG